MVALRCVRARDERTMSAMGRVNTTAHPAENQKLLHKLRRTLESAWSRLTVSASAAPDRPGGSVCRRGMPKTAPSGALTSGLLGVTEPGELGPERGMADDDATGTEIEWLEPRRVGNGEGLVERMLSGTGDCRIDEVPLALVLPPTLRARDRLLGLRPTPLAAASPRELSSADSARNMPFRPWPKWYRRLALAVDELVPDIGRRAGTAREWP